MDMFRSIGVFIKRVLCYFQSVIFDNDDDDFPVAFMAQTGTSGQIAGSVTDPNGRVIPGAT